MLLLYSSATSICIYQVYTYRQFLLCYVLNDNSNYLSLEQLCWSTGVVRILPPTLPLILEVVFFLCFCMFFGWSTIGENFLYLSLIIEQLIGDYFKFSPMVDHPKNIQKHRKNTTSRISARVTSKNLVTLVDQHSCSRDRCLKLPFKTHHSTDCLQVHIQYITGNATVQ